MIYIFTAKIIRLIKILFEICFRLECVTLDARQFRRWIPSLRGIDDAAQTHWRSWTYHITTALSFILSGRRWRWWMSMHLFNDRQRRLSSFHFWKWWRCNVERKKMRKSLENERIVLNRRRRTAYRIRRFHSRQINDRESERIISVLCDPRSLDSRWRFSFKFWLIRNREFSYLFFWMKIVNAEIFPLINGWSIKTSSAMIFKLIFSVGNESR